MKKMNNINSRGVSALIPCHSREGGTRSEVSALSEGTSRSSWIPACAGMTLETPLWLNYMIFALLALLLASNTALAHKVNIFAYVDSGKIYTESYFADGKPVREGKVLVYDSRENLLLEGTTHKDGLFSFEIPKVDDLMIVIDASMGHRNRFKLSKAEVEAGK